MWTMDSDEIEVLAAIAWPGSNAMFTNPIGSAGAWQVGREYHPRRSINPFVWLNRSSN